jgi:hypothetical protein
MTELIDTAPHEFVANYNFADGLRPWFACDRAVKDGEGSVEATFRHDGEPWTATLYYQDSGIVHPGDRTPAGTPMRIDEMREFRIAIEAGDDEAGQRSFNAHVRPRWDGMKTESDDGSTHRIDVPFREGVNVRVAGSNIEFDQYLQLLQKAAHAVDVNWSYFEDPHDSSNVQQAERYVRVHKDESGPVHARDGPLARLGHLLENDRDGHRKVEQADMNERGEQLPGYRHQVGVDEHRVQEVFANHSLPKRWKHYYAREALSRDDSDPLAHPKVGAIYYGSLWRDTDRKLGVSPSDLRQLTEELEDSVLSILHEAGLDVTSSAPYVEDAYFDATTRHRDRQVVELPLREIEATQESVVIENVADGLSPIQWESLEVLVTDGGEIAPQDIAESGGFHRDAVYRALDDMEELIDREYGSVSLRSTYVGQLVHDAVRSAKERTREAVEAASKAMDAADRGLDENTSALVAWASKHVENFRERDDGLEVDFGRIEADSYDDAMKEIRRALREGKRLWDEARKDEMAWRMGSYSARIETPTHDFKRKEAGTTVQAVGGRLWEIEATR